MTSSANTIKKLMKIEDVSDYLQISKPTIYRYVKKKQIPYIRVGSGLRFRERDIDEFIKNNCVKPRNM